MTDILTKNRYRHTDAPWENAKWGGRQRLKGCSCKPRNTKGFQPQKEEVRKDSSADFRGSMALLTAWLSTSKLQKCEIIHFYCFQLPYLWYFVIVVLEHYYTSPQQRARGGLVWEVLWVRCCQGTGRARENFCPLSNSQFCGEVWQS